MEEIGKIMGKTMQAIGRKNPKAPPHEISATVNLIESEGLFTKKYGRPYWFGKVKKARVGHSEMIGLLKEIRGMPGKYNKGGRLTNILTERAKKYGKPK